MHTTYLFFIIICLIGLVVRTSYELLKKINHFQYITLLPEILIFQITNFMLDYNR